MQSCPHRLAPEVTAWGVGVGNSGSDCRSVRSLQSPSAGKSTDSPSRLPRRQLTLSGHCPSCVTPDLQAHIPDIILAPFPHDPHPTPTVTSALEINPVSSPLYTAQSYWVGSTQQPGGLWLLSLTQDSTPHITFRAKAKHTVSEFLNTLPGQRISLFIVPQFKNK